MMGERPSFEYNQLIRFAIQVYLSCQDIKHGDMNDLSWNRKDLTIQQRINLHLYDAMMLLDKK